MKKSLVIALALMLVLAFASSAMAAQVLQGGVFLATTPTGMALPGDAPVGSVIYGVYQSSKFVADGVTHYPYEIYLPDEINPSNYRIHSSYNKNTDACASCHATHTAVNGMLLQWYSAYETCMACHDGTVTTTYNVVEGKVGATGLAASGGMFGTGKELYLSNHNSTGALEIAAAPGGSTTARTTSTSSTGVVTKYDWEIEFGCEACHDPHGNGGNARILKPNPNYAATNLASKNLWGPVSKKSTDGTQVLNSSDVALSGIQAVYQGLTNGTELKNGIGAVIGSGKAYYIAKPAAYTAESWVYSVGAGYTFLKPGRESYFAVKYGASNTIDLNTTGTYAPIDWYIDNSTGVTKAIYLGDPAIAVAGSVTFYGIPTLKVTMDIDGYLTVNEKVYHSTGMNNFCGACHTDYNTASQEVYYSVSESTGLPKNSLGGAYAYSTGTYSKAHRHTVGTERTITPVTDVLDFEWATGATGWATRLASSGAKKGVFTCLTCHVAHGTSQSYWQALLAGKTGPSGDAWVVGDMVELAGSSALKRLPNMGTCETCHNKENAQDGYAANSNIGAIPGVTHNDATPYSNNLNPVMTDAFWYIGEPLANLKADTWVGSAKCEPCHAEKVAGWKENKHYTDARINRGAGCGSFNMDDTQANCHMLGWLAKGKPAYDPTGANTFGFGGYDKNTLTSEASKLKNDDAAITCEACHGSAATHIQAPSSKNIYNPGAIQPGETTAAAFERENKSCGKCHSDREPVRNLTVAQINDGTIHDGPSAYAQSKHFKSGLVGCADCHDAHTEGAIKLEFHQLCASCHDSANLGTVDSVMGGGADHTFAFGIAGGISLPSTAIATVVPPTVQTMTYANLVAGNLVSNRVSPTLTITAPGPGFEPYYSFLGGTYTLTTTATAVYIPASSSTSPYQFSNTSGRVTFNAKVFTDNVAATNIKGTYSVKYVNTLNPVIETAVTQIFEVQ